MHNSLTIFSHSFWQSNIWRNILLSSHQAEHVEVFSDGDKSLLIEFRSVWFNMIGAFSLGINTSLYSSIFLSKAEEFVKKYGAIFWQREDYLDGNKLSLSSQKIVLQKRSLYKYFLEPYTRIIDLCKDEATILSEMHEKWRYNIRLAEKRWVTTLWVEATDVNIDIWMNLLKDTTMRDRFSHNSRVYYENFIKNLISEKVWGLLFAFFEWKVIAGGIFVYSWESALYYYGASVSDREMRKHMAPYLLQWEAIREGKKRGCIFYDFLWVSSPYWDDDGHLKGVTDFKEKFGWEIVSLWRKIHISLSYKDKALSLVRILKRFFWK